MFIYKENIYYHCIYIKDFLKRHFLFHALFVDFPPPATKQDFGCHNRALDLKVTLKQIAKFRKRISLVIGKRTL